ncbi:hypothetical protein [Pontibacter sp. G13]|uniref:hypothetical protein n=1 Tax=Pontibacter sp. G13 TaxID=3074898 RepID=UPI0028892234|nr:hypothetical protein [Pontibacter sp. G13]WNJ18030.1 hypothetical protein RJD25_24505 [Pontibacter sp. G13]
MKLCWFVSFACLLLMPELCMSQGSTWSVSGGYWGAYGSHPGGTARISRVLHAPNSPSVDVGYRLEAFGRIGAYHHSHSHTGAQATAGLSWHHVGRNRGFWMGASLEAGYLQAWIPATYRQDESGVWQEPKPSAVGYGVWMPSLIFGQDLGVKHGSPIGWYISPQMSWAAPATGGTSVNIFFELGLKYRFS